MELWKSPWNLLEIIIFTFCYQILQDYVPRVTLRQYKNKFSVIHLENKSF